MYWPDPHDSPSGLRDTESRPAPALPDRRIVAYPILAVPRIGRRAQKFEGALARHATPRDFSCEAVASTVLCVSRLRSPYAYAEVLRSSPVAAREFKSRVRR